MIKHNQVLSRSLWTEYDIYLFKQGKHFELSSLFGSHAIEINGQKGFYFAVYAPAAKSVSVVSDFNNWDRQVHRLNVRWDQSGVWEGFIPRFPNQSIYKYSIESSINNSQFLEKIDPYALHFETPPKTGSISWDKAYEWNDQNWMEDRPNLQNLERPISIYEVHIGSWKRKNGNNYLTYQELSKELIPYVKSMGFTHVEFLPLMEHPFDLSWGYQSTGYFAPTSRFGTPEDLKSMIDQFHQAGIGVILDWVPSHFPSDAFGLAQYDGSHVYEHPDPKKGYHPDWKSLIFNYERPEIRSFLISSAAFWAQEFHIDGIRVDAVASMLYLDYSRKEGEWDANKFGGNHNLEAISFLQELNRYLYAKFPNILMMAEESTSYPGVTKPVHFGGLGFGHKWMMGWMNDTLEYFSKDPIHRKFHQGQITFSMIYAFSENFTLPLSHDEVVHGKGSLIYKMPGDDWQRFANLRILFAYMFAHPGAKLLFMGNEFAQTSEWVSRQSLDWHLLEYSPHQGIQKLVAELNKLYQKEAALFQKNYEADGFEWIDISDHNNSVISFLRKGQDPDDTILVIANLTPTPHKHYQVGVSQIGNWEVLLDSDNSKYGGSNFVGVSAFKSYNEPYHNKPFSLNLKLPPLGIMYLKKE